MLFQRRFSSIIIICWPEADYLVKKDFDLYLSKTLWLKNCCFKHTYYNYNSWLEFMLHRYIDLQLRYFAWIACAANCQLPDNSEIKTIKRTKWLFEYVNLHEAHSCSHLPTFWKFPQLLVSQERFKSHRWKQLPVDLDCNFAKMLDCSKQFEVSVICFNQPDF